MRVMFHHPREQTIIGKFITFRTTGPFEHCELLFSDGVAFSSSGREGGARYKKIDRVSAEWVILELDICEDDEKIIRDFCDKKLGFKYDWLGILSYLFWRSMNSQGRYYCSEICAMALSKVSVIKFHHRMSPNSLYWQIKRSGLVLKEIIDPKFLDCCA